MKAKFYICRHCGNLVELVNNSGVPVVCCGQKMEALIPNTTDAAGEKHLPVVTVEGDLVKISVGSVNHPMLAEHFIEWVYLETDRGGHRISLKPDEAPYAEICLKNEKPIAAYAYCNLHGLWMTEI
ncbi:MAG: desulfoferrodoxin [Clostridia bacterium]|nr:desulfoferrodoxin [Clostridia bacterium]